MVREIGGPEVAVEILDGVEGCCEVLDLAGDVDVGVCVEAYYGVSLVRKVLDGVEEVFGTPEERLFYGVLGLHSRGCNLRK